MNAKQIKRPARQDIFRQGVHTSYDLFGKIIVDL